MEGGTGPDRLYLKMTGVYYTPWFKLLILSLGIEGWWRIEGWWQSYVCYSFLKFHKSSSWKHPSDSLQRVPVGICLIQNSWACCQEQLMISCNGLCLKNIWTETKALNLPDVLSTGYAVTRCFKYRELLSIH